MAAQQNDENFFVIKLVFLLVREFFYIQFLSGHDFSGLQEGKSFILQFFKAKGRNLQDYLKCLFFITITCIYISNFYQMIFLWRWAAKKSLIHWFLKECQERNSRIFTSNFHPFIVFFFFFLTRERNHSFSVFQRVQGRDSHDYLTLFLTCACVFTSNFCLFFSFPRHEKEITHA